MSNQDIVRGRQVVVPLTNRTGATISLGDVVVTDTTNDESFVTSTTSNYLATRIGVAQETIGIASNGRILVEGYAPQVNTVASVTRGLGAYHSTTAKKAQDGAQRIEGQFGEFLETGTNPSAIIFPTLLVPASSFGSNSNDVSSTSAGGASTLQSRADHVHRGVTAIAHASNTFYGTVTLTTPGNTVGITSPSSGTYALTSSGGSGGSGSGAATTNKYVTTAAASDLTAEVVIPGLAGSPDISAGGGSDDEFDTTDTGNPPTGWTAMGTLTAVDINSTAKSHLYMRKAASASTDFVGIYKAPPAQPYTVTAKLVDAYTRADFNKAFLFIAESTPGKHEQVYLAHNVVPGKLGVDQWTTPTSGGSVVVAGIDLSRTVPLYFRCVVTSSTNIAWYYSAGGLVWQLLTSGRNPGFTIAKVGLGISSENATYPGEAYFDWIRFT